MRWLVAFVVLAVSPACEATWGPAPWSSLRPGTAPFSGRALQQECSKVTYRCDSTKTKIITQYYEDDCTGDPLKSLEEGIAQIEECTVHGDGGFFYVTCSDSLEPLFALYSDSTCTTARGDPRNFASECNEICEEQSVQPDESRISNTTFVKYSCSQGSSDFPVTTYSDWDCSEATPVPDTGTGSPILLQPCNTTLSGSMKTVCLDGFLTSLQFSGVSDCSGSVSVNSSCFPIFENALDEGELVQEIVSESVWWKYSCSETVAGNKVAFSDPNCNVATGEELQFLPAEVGIEQLDECVPFGVTFTKSVCMDGFIMQQYFSDFGCNVGPTLQINCFSEDIPDGRPSTCFDSQGKLHSVPWTNPMQIQEKTVEFCESIQLTWQGSHNVKSVVTQTEYDTCDLSSATDLGITTSNEWNYQFEEAGEYFLVCGVSNHCLNGMKLKVTVREAMLRIPPPSPPPCPPNPPPPSPCPPSFQTTPSVPPTKVLSPPPRPLPPSPPPPAAILVTSKVTFADLSLSQADTDTFKNDFIIAMARAAEVDKTQVVIEELEAGSVKVNNTVSLVTAQEQSNADSFVAQLTNNVPSIFSSSAFSTYGEITSSDILIIGNPTPFPPPTTSNDEESSPASSGWVLLCGISFVCTALSTIHHVH